MAIPHLWSSRTLDAFEQTEIYDWVDSVPLSKKRGHIEKDFADGQLAAEIVEYYFPTYVDLKSYTSCQNVQDRIAQWKQLNQKVFRKIGLAVPSHTITQLSIAKSGVAQIFLNNLRACLSFARGAPVGGSPKIDLTTLNASSMHSLNGIGGGLGGLGGAGGGGGGTTIVTTRQQVAPTHTYVAAPIYPDPMWYKYNLRYNLLHEPAPNLQAIYPSEYEYYWQKKQADRINRTLDKVPDKTKKIGHGTILDSNSFTTPIVTNTSRVTLPPLSNQYTVSSIPITSNTYSKYDPKTKSYLSAPAEIQDLKEQLRRMELILQSKNARIQELLSQLERQKPYKKY